jgi:sigma-B regulation protein RsbU (phosphoserine phosphatase)
VRAIRYAVERDQFQQERSQWIEHELRLAAEIQKGFLPGPPPQTEGFEVGAYARPSGQVGGDFYDFYSSPDRKLGVSIGDAAGKGIPGALLIAKTQGVLQAEAHNSGSLAAVMERLNVVLCRNNETDRFVTLFSASLDVERMELTYANAGHLPALLYRREEVLALGSSGPLLGLFPDASYEQRVTPLAAGDTLVLYSDGVTEAVDAQETPFGEKGIESVIRHSGNLQA